jgi:hypothetical protein
MVLPMEWWGQRTGDPLCRTIARRWSRVMIALFAIGVITGTVLSFESGVLWPNFTATFGSVFGLGFAIEGCRSSWSRSSWASRLRLGLALAAHGPSEPDPHRHHRLVGS